MKHTTSDSDVTSLATTSPSRSPKRAAAAYYVQSPSRDSSHDDGDKSSSVQLATPVYSGSPLESPSHPSSAGGSHSRVSSASRFSGNLRLPSSFGGGGGGKASRKRMHVKGWREVGNAIDEEASYGEMDGEEELSRGCVITFWLSVLVLVFSMICLIVWGIARQYKPQIVAKSLMVNNFYAGEGTDYTGVPTKLVTVNCSLKIDAHNPSTLSGIHVSSTSIRLMYWEIAVANGQLEKFYQPRTSRRIASVILHGERIPLYGAGATFTLSNTGGSVPLTLDLAVKTRGYVIGQLVRVTHTERVKCQVVISSHSSKPIRLSACRYT